MKQEQEKRTLPKWYYPLLALSMIPLGLATWEAKDIPLGAYGKLNQRKYALEHLDPNAVHPNESQQIFSLVHDWNIVYKDKDGDGDYDSFLKRENSNGEFVEILMRKGPGRKIEFPNLSETAVNPLEAPRNSRILRLDYIPNGNGELESILILKDKRYTTTLIND